MRHSNDGICIHRHGHGAATALNIEKHHAACSYPCRMRAQHAPTAVAGAVGQGGTCAYGAHLGSVELREKCFTAHLQMGMNGRSPAPLLRHDKCISIMPDQPGTCAAQLSSAEESDPPSAALPFATGSYARTRAMLLCPPPRSCTLADATRLPLRLLCTAAYAWAMGYYAPFQRTLSTFPTGRRVHQGATTDAGADCWRVNCLIISTIQRCSHTRTLHWTRHIFASSPQSCCALTFFHQAGVGPPTPMPMIHLMHTAQSHSNSQRHPTRPSRASHHFGVPRTTVKRHCDAMMQAQRLVRVA